MANHDMHDHEIPVVDVDGPSTWPVSVRKHAERQAGFLRGSTRYVSDLKIPPDSEDDFRALLDGYLLKAYHATRLLAHEVELVRNQGLRTLSADLVAQRVDAAYAHGHVSGDERDRLSEANVFAEGRQGAREGRLSLFLGRHVLVDVHGIAPLLSTWGGEGIYMSAGGWAMRSRLEQLGRPAIVVVHVDATASWRTLQIYPQLEKLFVGHLLGLNEVAADVISPTAVPPEQVAEIWQPGSPDYDRFPGLPRS